ncbi:MULTISPECIES: S-type pyocin domain-containing protein [unclassified Pseudomonas]|uniref:S-type pyocin domain-containing protein n=1 Tax=unclassified Pseudomonas TaxID=196821 RepID=UPI0002722855|nr:MULTISPECIES: S-type pyocin domain-containing protein [unclassified Pseudomonas]EJM02123.1 membrane protein involved in colicin uptake [Pseudomonas sp. GM16]EJM27074.1 membrane protein involved in colicin uptake [Pseudomonas sp. GM24]
MQRPPFLELDETRIEAPAPDNYEPFKESNVGYTYSGTFGPAGANAQTRQLMFETQTTVEQEFNAKSVSIPQSIEVELAAIRLEGPTNPLPPAAALAREVGVRNTLIHRKSAEFQRQTAIANRFFGSDPLGKTFQDYLNQASAIRRISGAGARSRALWSESFRAAHEARLLGQTLALLNQQQADVLNWLATVQAQDQAQAAAAEAQRLAAEHARIAAEQQRQREIAEAARQEQEQIRAREQARLATLAKKQDLDAYLAKYSAQLARILAEMRAEAQEQARIAALKSALAEAQAKAEAAAQAFAAEQARLQAQMEQRVEANQQEGHSAEIQHVYPASGAVASTSPVLSFASKTIRLPPASSSGILSAMRTGLLAVRAAGAALMSGPVLVGFAALLMPSRLGNGERFSMSVPLAELSPESPQTLREIADRQGTLELPVGLGVRRVGAGAEIFVATSDDFHIRSSVLVLNAAYDLLNDVYEVALRDSPTDFLTWTPAISPGNSSTVSPIAETDAPAYSGAPIVPIEGRLDLNPILVEGWERFVIVFPDDSGIAPLYVVFSSPYGGVEDGEHSGRDFNPEETGLPVTSSDWVPSIIAKNGIDIVKLHTSKFPDSDANKIMIDRLERFFRGELEVTDTDKRFYTHEIREFERLKALGYDDTEMPDKDSSVWNNVHTATLEDYKLKDDPTLLYTPEALEAARRQEEREYQKLLKEMW